jgi:SSS family solute:Na+ symporter
MSTVSTSLNSSATLLMRDFYQRYLRPDATERQCMTALYSGTVVWGALGTGVAILLASTTGSALDAWWTLSSIFSGGIVGLFLLGMISRASNPAAITAVLIGLLVIAWMSLSPTEVWPAALADLRSPFHKFMIVVVGTLTILLTGLVISGLMGKRSEEDWKHGGH